MLAVAIAPDDIAVAALERVLEAGLHGPADAEVAGEVKDERAVFPGDGRRMVERAVIQHGDIRPRGRLADFRQETGQGTFLIKGRKDDQ